MLYIKIWTRKPKGFEDKFFYFAVNMKNRKKEERRKNERK
jgi:hypothetical protein